MQCGLCNAKEELILITPGGNLSHYWQCFKCGSKVYPGSTRQSEAEQLWNSEQAYKRMMASKKGGGSSSKGRKKKPNKKADVWTEV